MNKSISQTFSSETIADFFYNNHYGAIGVIFACLLASFSFVHLTNNEVQTESEHTKRIREYESGYLEELRALDDTDPDVEVLSNAKMVESTPFGKVIMMYSVTDETFLYYADTRSIPYKTLDAVARQFTVKYSCKRICVNYKEEWEKAKARAIAEEKEEKELNKKPKSEQNIEDSQDKPRDVFVKFKKYNTYTNDINNNSRKDSIKRRRYRTDKRVNRFTHKGRLDDYVDPIVKADKNRPVLSFAEFKAKQKSS